MSGPNWNQCFTILGNNSKSINMKNSKLHMIHTCCKVYNVYFLLNCCVWKVVLKTFNGFVTACRPLNKLNCSLLSSLHQYKHIGITCYHHTYNYHTNNTYLSYWHDHQYPQTHGTPIAIALLLCVEPISISYQPTWVLDNSPTQIFFMNLFPTIGTISHIAL